MQEEMTIETRAIKEKMTSFIGDTDLDTAYIREIGSRLNPELVPIGALTLLELLAFDMAVGKNGFTGAPLAPVLCGLPDTLVQVMTHATIVGLDKWFPTDFAAEVAKIYSDLLANLAKE